MRSYSLADTALVRTVVDDPHIPSITSVPRHGDDAAIEAYIQRQIGRARDGEGYQFVVLDTHSGVAVGQAGVMLRSLDEGRAGIGYWISPAQRRRGYATAALRMLVGWASAIEGVERLELVVEPWNEGSWRAAEAAGFVREGLLRRWERVGGVSRDMYMYAYLPT